MKLAIVIPWFGRELKGGAEQLAWHLATRLVTRRHLVDVLTTCCRSHQDDWAENHLPAGAVREREGFTIHRFAVERRDRVSFDAVCGALQNLPPAALKAGVSPLPPAESAVFARELIKSRALLDYLGAHKNSYDWFILLPYLYGPVLEGTEIVRNRAALQPCLHDEAYAYLPEVEEAFRHAGRLLFNSDGEKELALRLFGPGIWEKSVVVGSGVEIPEPASSDPRIASPDPYVLYLGRKEAGKNVPMLIHAFRRFRAVRPNSRLRLRLAGNGQVDLGGAAQGIDDLGLVDDATKECLLQNCRALFQPSQNESFSRVMMEAWRKGKPVAAHASCLATAVAVRRSGGGWLAGSEDEWAQLFVDLDRINDAALEEIGQRGRAYAEDLADWDKVLDRYETALAPAAVEITARSRKSARGSGDAQINQFLPNLAYGDAISNHALWIRGQVRKMGLRSEIYVCHRDPQVGRECAVFSPDVLDEGQAAIYHHSIGSEITPYLRDFPGAKCLIYHNITPAEFFEPYRPDFARILERGRADLATLAPYFELSCGDSTYNRRELESAGFQNPIVIPITVDPRKWSAPPDPGLMAQLQDGRTNLLFVGRIAPNKKQDDLVAAFAHFLEFDPEARLILVGQREENDPYWQRLLTLIETLDLRDAVVILGGVNDSQLAACFRTAHLFWSMSEHEGFCVPLVEAMWFDVPVLAFDSSAVPETLGAGGIRFTDKTDLHHLAALASLMVDDEDLRATVTRAARRQRSKFVPEAIAPLIENIVGNLLGSPAPNEAERRRPAGALV